MSYLVLARKWRPQQLAEIVGQEHVTRTLSNALRTGRLAHAFLFTGARGVGKTSAARILAKALCCEANPEPNATPCGVCAPCVEIGEGRATDIFEIDAASNTGVGNVREIIDNVRYLPSRARFKIYIIDEVHMLSTGAFNALLKTLEEPPPHVKFILATTDVHKIPVTILSRCQRYDFRRISIALVTERLSSILTAEQIEHEPSSLTLVARESEGSMRDAQSLLEQVLTFADGRPLDAQLVREALGVADRGMLADLLEALLERRPGDVIERVREVYERGIDLKRFGDALVEYTRDLVVAKLVPEPSALLDRPKDEVAALIERAARVDSIALERLFRALCTVVEETAESAYPRFSFEIGLASLAEAPAHVPLESLVAKLDQIELSLAGRPSASGGAGGPRSFPAPALKPPRAEVSPEQQPPESFRPKSERTGRPAPPPRPALPERAPWSPPAPPRVPSAPAPPRGPTNGPAREPARGAEWSSAETEPRGAVAVIDAPVVARVFPDFVQLIKSRRPTLFGSLAQVRPLRFEPGRVELGCETRFDEAALGGDDTRRFLENLLGDFFGTPTTLQVARVTANGTGEVSSSPRTLNELVDEATVVRRRAKELTARQAPSVQHFVTTFGAEIAKIRVIDEE